MIILMDLLFKVEEEAEKEEKGYPIILTHLVQAQLHQR
jgi:hypothetical protein